MRFWCSLSRLPELRHHVRGADIGYGDKRVYEEFTPKPTDWNGKITGSN